MTLDRHSLLLRTENLVEKGLQAEGFLFRDFHDAFFLFDTNCCRRTTENRAAFLRKSTRMLIESDVWGANCAPFHIRRNDLARKRDQGRFCGNECTVNDAESVVDGINQELQKMNHGKNMVSGGSKESNCWGSVETTLRTVTP